MPENEVPKAPEQAITPTAVVPAVAATPPSDELAETIDQFIATVQTASMKSLKSMLTQFVEKADAAITKLDIPPKKQG